MKSLLSKNLILVVAVVAALTAGTALLAGYVDGPQGVQADADSMCADCPRAGTPSCCKIAGSCQHNEKETATTAVVASTCGGCGEKSAETNSCAAPASTCGAAEAAGCEENKIETGSCSGAGCGGQTQGACVSGGCCPSK